MDVWVVLRFGNCQPSGAAVNTASPAGALWSLDVGSGSRAVREGKGGCEERPEPPAKPRAGFCLGLAAQAVPAQACSHPLPQSSFPRTLCRLPALPQRAQGVSLAPCVLPACLHPTSLSPRLGAFLLLAQRPARGPAQCLLRGILARRC